MSGVRPPKRQLEETSEQAVDKKTKLDNEGAQPPAEEGGEEEKHEVRILIDGRQVGSVIGRGGSNVTRLRQECDVFMSILKAPEGVKERILTIKGHTENIAQACRGIGQILQEVQVQRAQKSGEEAKAEDSNVSFRFLVHQTRVGGVIGKAGALVQQTQQTTGARVQVSVEALGSSTEKSVTVSGTVDRVYEACKIVVGQIRANPLRAGVSSILYDPAFAGAGPNDFNPFFQQGGPHGHAPPHGYSQGYPYQQPQQYGGYGGPPPGPPHSHQPYSQPSYSSQPPQSQPFNPYPPAYSGAQGGPGQSAALSRQKIVIPSVCAGNVIGRGGSIISKIRQQSGTFISIADPEPHTPRERMVTISGSPQGIQTAVHLIGQVVEQFESPAPARDIPTTGY